MADSLAGTGLGDAVRWPWCGAGTGSGVPGRVGDGTGDAALVPGTDGTGVGMCGLDGTGVGATVGGCDGDGTGFDVGGRVGDGTGDGVAWPPAGNGVAVAPEWEAGRASPCTAWAVMVPPTARAAPTAETPRTVRSLRLRPGRGS
ncbi:hypothetical protein [Streptomyces sp. NPDC002386]